MWISRILAVVVTLTVCACDNFGHVSLSFPAEIKSIEGFEGESKAQVSERVDKLMDTVGMKFLIPPGEKGTGSVVTIKLVEELTSVGETSGASHVDDVTVIQISGRGATNPNRIAGRATRYGNECQIEISKFVLEYDDELLQPVLWHEIGHCAGLNHLTVTDKIMSPVTYPLNHYSQSDIDEFVKQLRAALHV